MKFIENIYFDENQNKYIIDHSKGISTIEKSDIKFIKYQFAYTDKYSFIFPLVIILTILNFSFRNFSFPIFFENKLAYTLLIIILFVGLILCIEYYTFFRSKITIHHKKNDTFYFDQDTVTFNIYGAFQSREIKCHRFKPTFDKEDFIQNSFFPVFCLMIPTLFFAGSFQSLFPQINLQFISDFKKINFLWLISIIIVFFYFRDVILAFIYVPCLLIIGIVNIWEKKYSEKIYHEIFTNNIINCDNLISNNKTTIYSSLVTFFIYYTFCVILLDFTKIPLFISLFCIIFLVFHRFLYLRNIKYDKIDNVCLYYLNDSKLETQFIIHKNYNALASITPGYLFCWEREHFHLLHNKKWLNEKFEIFQNYWNLGYFNSFFPEFVNIQYFKTDYLSYIKNVTLEEIDELKIINHFILDEEILVAFMKRGIKIGEISPIDYYIKRFLVSNVCNKLDSLIKKSISDKKNNYVSYLQYATNELKNEKNFILNLVKHNGNELQFTSKELQNDIEIVMQALKSDSNALQFASKELQNNKQVVLEAINKMSPYKERELFLVGLFDENSSENIFKFASDELKSDREIVLKAIEKDKVSFKYASKELQIDLSFIFEVINIDVSAINFTSREIKNNKELILEILKSNGSALKYVSKELQNDKEIVLQAVKSNGISLKFASPKLKMDREIVIHAVNSNGLALKYAFIMLRNDKEIILKAVNSNGMALEFASDELKNNKVIVLQAVKTAGSAFHFASKRLQNDNEIVLESIKSDIYPLDYYAGLSPYILNKLLEYRFKGLNEQTNEQTILSALKLDGNVLKILGFEYQNCKEFVFHAVKSNGLSIEYASNELKNDKNIVMEAIKSNGLALQFVSNELKSDKYIVNEAIKMNGLALQFASIELQNDKNIVIEAIKSNGLAIDFASKELQLNKDIVIEALRKNPRISEKYISNKLLDDRDFIIEFDKLDNIIKGKFIYKLNKSTSKKVKYMLNYLKLFN